MGRIDCYCRLNQVLVRRGSTDLGTTFVGGGTERPLPDGTALVHVKPHGRNVSTVRWMGQRGELQVFGYAIGPCVLAGYSAAPVEIVSVVDAAGFLLVSARRGRSARPQGLRREPRGA